MKWSWLRIKIHAKTGKILEIEREYNDKYYYN